MGAIQSRLQSVAPQSSTAPAATLLADNDRSTTPQAANITSFPDEGRPDRDHFRFLDLSPEIRNMIYKEVLFVGKIHFAPERQPNAGRHYYERGYEKPQLSLLRVCKQAHAEAEPLYLSMNLFELPDNFT
jgi:hypothetical protein